ncbi:MAG: hypothetical protein OIF55_03495 [Amphritea sp.]|nr:hypothetical protein [Amphritea sp.]
MDASPRCFIACNYAQVNSDLYPASAIDICQERCLNVSDLPFE